MADAGSIVVVGAGPGLGVAVARRFGREGYRVGLVARRQEMVDQLVEELAVDKIEAFGAAGDAGSRKSLRRALDTLTECVGEPTVFVYNVSVTVPGLPSKVDADDVLDALASMVGGLVNGVQRVLPAMRAERRGTILVTGSGVAIDPWVEAAGLSLSKAAQRNYAHSLHREVIDDDVHAATVTIRGVMQPGTAFDPQLIAEDYWTLHRQPRAEWSWEHVYRPAPEDRPEPPEPAE
jgi:NADP-dependent 3-hydroxy acid dehydrogenase YdfG